MRNFGPFESKAHNPLPASSDMAAGQEVDDQLSLDYPRTSKSYHEQKLKLKRVLFTVRCSGKVQMLCPELNELKEIPFILSQVEEASPHPGCLQQIRAVCRMGFQLDITKRWDS